MCSILLQSKVAVLYKTKLALFVLNIAFKRVGLQLPLCVGSFSQRGIFPQGREPLVPFPHPDLLGGFSLLSFLLCVGFGGFLLPLHLLFLPLSFHFYARSLLFIISLISTRTQCIRIQVLIFNLLNKGVEEVKVCGRAKRACLVLISMEAVTACSGLVLLFAEPEMLEGRVGQ